VSQLELHIGPSIGGGLVAGFNEYIILLAAVETISRDINPNGSAEVAVKNSSL